MEELDVGFFAQLKVFELHPRLFGVFDVGQGERRAYNMNWRTCQMLHVIGLNQTAHDLTYKARPFHRRSPHRIGLEAIDPRWGKAREPCEGVCPGASPGD